jgi:hypothetical protein
MAAMLGSARQWQLFQRKLRNLQAVEQFSIFHGKEIRGFGEDRGGRILIKLTELVRDELTEGFCTSLEYERYINEYRLTPTPRGISLDSQYGVCFRILLYHIVNKVVSDGRRTDCI